MPLFSVLPHVLMFLLLKYDTTMKRKAGARELCSKQSLRDILPFLAIPCHQPLRPYFIQIELIQLGNGSGLELFFGSRVDLQKAISNYYSINY